ncbi:glycoside hydrolase family 65 protein [Kordiimonas pumila]|uniref:Glycoside hydrolase family 65 protein n=1 Tax=Kordiimonas pumila TaxID=2161677 RepID=A0ABV7D6J8_9PROT|nr:glycoside hydrolase family 65 protein [Kordiimonas pumila]
MGLVESNKNNAGHGMPDAWLLNEPVFDAAQLAVRETLMAQANGYLGTRGTYEEPVAAGIDTIEGTYINGAYLREPIHYDEKAYGFATHNNKMIMVPDVKRLMLRAGDSLLEQGSSSFTENTRSLDMRDGLLVSTRVWQVADTKSVRVRTKRFVSSVSSGLMVQEIEISSIDYSGPISLGTGIDAGYGIETETDDPRAGALSIRQCLAFCNVDISENTAVTTHTITDSERVIVTACGYDLESTGAVETCSVEESSFWGWDLALQLKAGERLLLRKYTAYADGAAENAEMLAKQAQETVEKAKSKGFENLMVEQRTAFAGFWKSADIEIQGDEAVQQGMRFNMFHLYQSTGRDGKRSLGAKGLSGPGYDGHYFWDTEIYAVPFFVFTQPATARSLITYRINALEGARARARIMGHSKGALYPWRTIGGEECSSFFPASTAQYHINAAIAYALIQYLEATEDQTILKEGGAEMLFETARLWMGLGQFSDRHDGKFCIFEVTGPDEYTAMVDNNLYTNAMAQHHLAHAAKIFADLQVSDPILIKGILDKTGMRAAEAQDWEKAANLMYLPYDDTMKVHEQCEGFFAKPEWDFAGTPAEKHPLLLHYHPLVIYRHQVLKQADVVLAQVLLSAQFSTEDKRRNLAYYEPRTTHDSTLSACMYSIANSEVGDRQKAYEMFEETYRMDLENRHANTHYGLHMACMAGSWLSLVYGFAGVRFEGGTLYFNPYLPKGWDEYSFSMHIKGRVIAVCVTASATVYKLHAGNDLEISHKGSLYRLVAGQPFKAE